MRLGLTETIVLAFPVLIIALIVIAIVLIVKAIKKNNQAPDKSQLSQVEELEKLKELLDKGIITQEEFDAKFNEKKNKLMNE